MGGMKLIGPRARLLKTRQITKYHIGDNGDAQKGLPAQYAVLSTGQYSGVTVVDNPHYTAATISFESATKKIKDSANGLITVLAGDTIVVKGTVSNPGVFTVVTGGVAGEIVVGENLTNEAAGALMTICKRVTPSNNVVQDLNTGNWWLRYTTGGPALKVGPASNGKLCWYDAANCYTLHPAAADLQMIADSKILRIVGGAGEIGRYFVGSIIVCSGFANTANNLPGYRINTIAINGADLDLTLWTGIATMNPLVSEAAAGARAIKIICRSIFSYVAACNAAGIAGYSDWRIPMDVSLKSLCDMEQPAGTPDATAMPSWPTSDYFWSSTTNPVNTSSAVIVSFYNGVIYSNSKVNTYFVALVRGS